MKITRLVLAMSIVVLSQSARADGPGSYGSMSPPSASQSLTKEQRAIDTYNDGYKLVQRGDDFSAQSAAPDDKGAKAAHKAYKNAIKKFDAAVKLDPWLYEAYTYLGYANRKLGKLHDANETMRGW